jgi:periplasmic protein TonB
LNANIKNNHNVDNTLIWALVASILLHVIFAVVVPKFKADSFKKLPDILTVELVKPKKPEPIIQPIEPVEAEPKKPKEIKPKEAKPKEEKPAPIKKIIEPKPTEKTEQPTPQPAQDVKPEPQPEPQLPKVIAVTPKPEEKPVFVAPTPQPEPTNEEDINAARSAFKKSVRQELKTNLRYPKIAERKGISGEVKVEISFDKEGNVISANIVESSGNDSLDEAALDTVKRTNIKQYMKKILAGHVDTITVPIVFTIANN